MSIWSCARHNGMTGAGSDRDAGPTPVQRARFRGICSRKRQSVRIYLRRLERTRCTPGRQQREVEAHRDECLYVVPPPAASINCFPSHPGINVPVFDIPPHPGLSEGYRAGIPGTAARRMHRAAAPLQSMPRAITHEGLIERCRIYTDHAEDPSHIARESGRKARSPVTPHGRSTRAPRLCRDLQGTRWE